MYNFLVINILNCNFPRQFSFKISLSELEEAEEEVFTNDIMQKRIKVLHASL